ncbi:DUF892 family protein [Mucilaginibacter ginkgonis]|uniref:DUF892 family protein n=1 Tax=Mucilaginibacter ginkgonis TaxID=2682091 RepID=A0A6I4HWA3_9SPHI|nr:DUF892 family protein [Mucilaginibacter ginkgonis]QQL51220.1 DUF892 family protein [Mucilaginibacter ginkgonis]
MNNQSDQMPPSGLALDVIQRNRFFVKHLNRVFCVKVHLLERLPELEDQSEFNDLKFAIAETLQDVQKQIARMRKIYLTLDKEADLSECGDLTNFIEEGFTAVFENKDQQSLRDLSIIFYLSVIESVEATSFRLLKMVAKGFKSKEIDQLLLQSIDESNGDRKLLLQIAARHTI